jgi:hypothetical protein
MISVRIYTMLGRCKIYAAERYYEADGKLIIYGMNEESKVKGKFVYPLINIEYYNIANDEIYTQELNDTY